MDHTLHPNRHICQLCSFVTTHRSNYTRHLKTKKHRENTCPPPEIDVDDCISDMSGQGGQGGQGGNLYECMCGNTYGHRQSLFKHKQTCVSHKNGPTMLGLTEAKLFEIITQAIDKPSTNTNNQYTRCKNANSNNSFNIQLFLNNDCKDAITLIEFVASIQLKLKDLEDTAQNGFVETMTRIMTASLNDLDVTKRPIHSTDAKRGVMYVKDDAGWEKDTGHEKITAAINKVEKTNLRQIPEWVKENPGANDAGTKENTTFMKILEKTVHDDASVDHSSDVDKVIKRVARAVVVGK